MAFVVESTASASVTASSTLTITKPTGLAEGDLMVAVLATSSGVATTINTASGWTLVANQAYSNGSVNIQYKEASSGDASATDFDFTSSGNGNPLGGSMMRVTGQAVGAELDDSDSDQDNTANSATISFTTTVSPATDGNLIVTSFGANDADSGAGSMSTYVASDGTLSWTELFDYSVDAGSSDPIIGGAYAIQSTATALTSYGATLSDSKDNHGGIIAVFQAQTDVTGTPELVTDAGETFEVSGSVGVTGTLELVEDGGTTFEVSGQSVDITQWTNDSKGSNTWTNESL